MSQSVVYYSHTYYGVNWSFDAVKCDIWSCPQRVTGEVNIEMIE